MMSMVLERKDISLYLLDLPVELEGYSYFLNSWLLKDKEQGLSILVDPGPSETIPHLVRAMAREGVLEPHIVLITHVHIDHSGGAGHLAEIFPGVSFVVAEKGIKHLSEPSRLWESSLATLGDKALAYGSIRPVPAGNLQVQNNSLSHLLTVIETPGHASHHRSYLYRDILFCGEAAGVHLPWKEEIFSALGNARVRSSLHYLRPATPPPFNFQVTVSSLLKLQELFLQPSLMCYSHYGFTSEPSKMLASHMEQLFLWRDLIGEYLRPEALSEIRGEDAFIQEALLNLLLEKDPRLAGFGLLDANIRKREEYFLLNSIKGFVKSLI